MEVASVDDDTTPYMMAGCRIADALSAVPRIRPELFDQIFNSNLQVGEASQAALVAEPCKADHMVCCGVFVIVRVVMQDMLMVSYFSSLTKANLAIADRIIGVSTV